MLKNLLCLFNPCWFKRLQIQNYSVPEQTQLYVGYTYLSQDFTYASWTERPWNEDLPPDAMQILTVTVSRYLTIWSARPSFKWLWIDLRMTSCEPYRGFFLNIITDLKSREFSYKINLKDKSNVMNVEKEPLHEINCRKCKILTNNHVVI